MNRPNNQSGSKVKKYPITNFFLALAVVFAVFLPQYSARANNPVEYPSIPAGQAAANFFGSPVCPDGGECPWYILQKFKVWNPKENGYHLGVDLQISGSDKANGKPTIGQPVYAIDRKSVV